MKNSARGFTLLELSVTLTVGAILIPAVFATHRALDARHQEVLARVSVAEQARRVSESIRADLRAGRMADTEGLRVAMDCGEVRYAVEPGPGLWREAPASCGGRRPLARDVRSLSRSGGLIQLGFRVPTGRDAAYVTVVRLGVHP